MENFATRIEAILETRKITKKDFCKDMSIPIQSMYDWKNKGCYPSVLVAIKIAQYLDTTAEYLVTGNSNNPYIKTIEEKDRIIKQLQQQIIQCYNNMKSIFGQV